MAKQHDVFDGDEVPRASKKPTAKASRFSTITLLTSLKMVSVRKAFKKYKGSLEVMDDESREQEIADREEVEERRTEAKAKRQQRTRGESRSWTAASSGETFEAICVGRIALPLPLDSC